MYNMSSERVDRGIERVREREREIVTNYNNMVCYSIIYTEPI